MSFLIPIVFFIAFTSSVRAQSCPPNINYFCMTPEMAPDSLISEQDFYLLPVKIMNLLKTAVTLEAKWGSPYFGAGMYFYDNSYRMMILGGTTRIKGMSLDAYAAVICHEMGHLIGGKPLQTIKGAEWSSSEGQSDFFAASICLPKYFESIGVRSDLIASRVEEAGFNMLSSFKFLESGKLVRFKKDDSIAVETLINVYPSLQCRYENFRDNKTRPACWFKP